MVMKPLSFNRI